MNTHTRLSAKGQVVIPKDVRDARGWGAGTDFEVVVRPDGVLLRLNEAKPELTFAQAMTRLREAAAYDGPYAPESEWQAAIDRMFIESAAEDTAREGR